MSYILALVYHARGADEQPELREVVDRSVHIDPHRKEYKKMGQTIAEMYIEQGRVEGEIKGKHHIAETWVIFQLVYGFLS